MHLVIFALSQRLSPTKTYTKDSVSMHHQNEATKAVDSSVSVATSSSGIVHGLASNTSPGQVFGSPKIAASNLYYEGSGHVKKDSGTSSATSMQGKVTSHLSPGQVFSSLRIGSSEFQGDRAALSSKEIGQQLSQDLSERLERIQRTHTGQHTQQQKHQQQPDYPNLGLQPHRGSSLTTSPKLPAGSSSDVATASLLVYDSLEQFVCELDTQSGSVSQSASRTRSANPEFVSLSRSGIKDKPLGQSPAVLHKGLDSLEAFVRDKSVSTELSPTPIPVAQSSIQIHSDSPKQLSLHDDSDCSEVPPKHSQQVHVKDSTASQPSESYVQKTSTRSLYRIDSASPSQDEFDTSTAKHQHNLNRDADDNDYRFDNSWLFLEGVHSTSAAPFATSSYSSSSRMAAFHGAATDHSTSLHGRMRNSEYSPDVSSMVSPSVPLRVQLSKKDDFDDFVGTFVLPGASDSRVLGGKCLLAKARDEDDDFVPSFHVFPNTSKNTDTNHTENSFTHPCYISTPFRPIFEGSSSEHEFVKASPSNSAQLLSHSARYIARDSQGIELLATALSKVQDLNCPSLSNQALKKLLTPILRKFDLVAFANKVKVPTLMAADLVQLAPFNIHFLVDDSVDLLSNGTNWNDAQTLLQECIDFVSLVNTNGCTISFLSSSVSQSYLKSKDQVASLFARVMATSPSHRFAAVSKLSIVAAFESKVFEHIFAGITPALVYMLSLQDIKRDHLSAGEMLRVYQSLDSRIAHRFDHVNHNI